VAGFRRIHSTARRGPESRAESERATWDLSRYSGSRVDSPRPSYIVAGGPKLARWKPAGTPSDHAVRPPAAPASHHTRCGNDKDPTYPGPDRQRRGGQKAVSFGQERPARRPFARTRGGGDRQAESASTALRPDVGVNGKNAMDDETSGPATGTSATAGSRGGRYRDRRPTSSPNLCRILPFTSRARRTATRCWMTVGVRVPQPRFSKGRPQRHRFYRLQGWRGTNGGRTAARRTSALADGRELHHGCRDEFRRRHGCRVRHGGPRACPPTQRDRASAQS